MKKDNIFWIGYSDLMTSLFFVMLVLFVVVISSLNTKNAKLRASYEQLKNITQIERQFKPLEESGYFDFLPGCNKYVVKDLIGKEIFMPNQSVIKPEYRKSALRVGVELESFLKDLYAKNNNLSYLLVIEGNVANKFDKSIDMDSPYGYRLSYERALALYELWRSKGIELRKYNTEIMICGSGFNGLCRANKEENNKRFSIQLIPKVGKIQ